MKTWTAEEVLALANEMAKVQSFDPWSAKTISEAHMALRDWAARLKLDESVTSFQNMRIPEREVLFVCKFCGCDNDKDLSNPPAQAAQDGDAWVLVPRSITSEMEIAGSEALRSGRVTMVKRCKIERIYAALIASAPTPAQGDRHG